MSKNKRRSEEKKEKFEAREGHEGEEEMATKEECVEAKMEVNSMHEENDVSNGHMTWWKNAWWIRVDSGPHMRTEEAEGEKWGTRKRERDKPDNAVQASRVTLAWQRNSNHHRSSSYSRRNIATPVVEGIWT